MRTAEEARGFRRSLCCLFKSSVSHVSSPCILSGLCWKTLRQGSFTSDWSGCPHCPHQRRWMRYGSCGPSKEFFSRRQNFSPKTTVFDYFGIFTSSISGTDKHQSSAWSSQRWPVFSAARRLPGLCQEPACKSCPISQHAPAKTLLYQSG